MRITNQQEFNKLPEGTIFKEIEKDNLQQINCMDICQKTAQWEHDSPYLPLFDYFKKDNDHQEEDCLGCLDFGFSRRDGDYLNEKISFVIYSKEEVLNMIKYLKKMYDFMPDVETQMGYSPDQKRS